MNKKKCGESRLESIYTYTVLRYFSAKSQDTKRSYCFKN